MHSIHCAFQVIPAEEETKKKKKKRKKKEDEQIESFLFGFCEHDKRYWNL